MPNGGLGNMPHAFQKKERNVQASRASSNIRMHFIRMLLSKYSIHNVAKTVNNLRSGIKKGKWLFNTCGL